MSVCFSEDDEEDYAIAINILGFTDMKYILWIDEVIYWFMARCL